MHLIYLIHEFHNLSWITEMNELFHDILIYWDAPVDGQGTNWLKIKLHMRNVHWSNYPPLLYPHKMLTVDYIFQLLYEVLVEHKNRKGHMQAPLWKNEFFVLFLTMPYSDEQMSRQNIQISRFPQPHEPAAFWDLPVHFWPMSSLTSHLSSVVGLVFRTRPLEGTAVPQPSHNVTYSRGRSLAVTTRPEPATIKCNDRLQFSSVLQKTHAL